MKPTKLPKRPTLRWDQHKRQRGIQGFVPFATLNTQWVWMKNRRDPVWSHVHLNTAFETDGEWKVVITKIKSTAETLRFEICERMEDDSNTSHSSPSVSDDERGTTFNEPAAAMRPHSFSTPETVSPMGLLFPRRDHVLNGSSRDNESIDQSIDHNNLHNDPHKGILNRLPGSTEPVVTSQGKLCLWCEHEGASYDSEDIQKPQGGDHNYDSGYEYHSHGNQNNNRRDNPTTREYAQGLEQLMRELDGEFPHLDEDCSDSESESLMTTQEIPKGSLFCNLRIPLPSDREQELLNSEDSSDWCADRGSPAILPDFGTTSISMEDRSGALEDDRVFTRKSLSKYRFPHSRTIHDNAPDCGLGGQRAFQYGWPSDDETRVETLRQMSAEALRQVENQSTTHFSNQGDMDVLMYDGNTWNQV
ncbi:hypothetical protein PITC_041990 [Penicillium italicum]|uniref:Uncharacterized protein n=1 Tax=Penicillium italicum TaxID=40296 RepID=A0A0A2KKV4_PENIT|nr:hypothetical protein PITC_041990 [Penicillium italicum]